MAVLHVPASLRAVTDGRERFDVPGATTLRQVFQAVERECPELAARVVEDGELRADMAVAIDGSIIEDGGIYTEVDDETEIYLVPPIGGG